MLLGVIILLYIILVGGCIVWYVHSAILLSVTLDPTYTIKSGLLDTGTCGWITADGPPGEACMKPVIISKSVLTKFSL